MKKHIRRALELESVGRPIRKVLWLFLKVSEYQHRLANKLFGWQPYVRKITLSLESAGIVNDQDSGLARYYSTLKLSVESLTFQPKISVLIPVYKVDARYLKECLESLVAQIYTNWEACIIDDASGLPYIDEILSAFEARFPDKVRYGKNEKNFHISHSSNQALSLATGDYVALLDHDDRLMPNALAEVARFINLHQQPDILYSDECIIDERGSVFVTYSKPDWSPYMHLSVNYTTHLSVYKKSLLDQVGGFRASFEGAQDHDLMLRATEQTKLPIIHIPICLYQWRSHKLSTASNSCAKPYAAIAGERALKEACERRGLPAHITFEPAIHHFKVHFQLPIPSPVVSIIILSRDAFDLVKTCLNSLFERSNYLTFEVILVDHDSKDPSCLSLFEQFTCQHPSRFKVIRYEGPFNFARMNNHATSFARGDYFIFLNNDTEIKTSTWIQELLSYGQLPDVGAVGPKLLYPSGRIQHAGIIGLGSQIAGHMGLGEKEDTLAYFAYHQTTHEVSAVTGACLLVARKKYEEVGGFEEIYVPNGFGDVDFCLKLIKKGYSNIYVPYAVLEHKESVTRKVSFELFEHYYMLQNWGRDLVCDPYRNPSLEVGTRFKIEERFRMQAPSSAYFAQLLRADHR